MPRVRETKRVALRPSHGADTAINEIKIKKEVFTMRDTATIEFPDNGKGCEPLPFTPSEPHPKKP